MEASEKAWIFSLEMLMPPASAASTLSLMAFSARPHLEYTSLNAMTAQFARTGATLDTLLAAVNRGEGTLGKFASDSGLYVDMRGTLQSLKQLIDEIKREPGRLTVQLKVF